MVDKIEKNNMDKLDDMIRFLFNKYNIKEMNITSSENIYKEKDTFNYNYK